MKPYRQTFTLTDMDVDRFCRLKLSSLLFYAQEVAGKHSALLGADYDTLLKKKLFWAVTRHKVQITRLPTLGETITVETVSGIRRMELHMRNGLVGSATVDMGKAVLDAANILVITGAGGAFGEVLKKVDFTTFLPEKVSAMGVWILLLPLGFAALLKTAQGSSTLAILTAASITAPLLEPLGLTTPVMRALACCAVCCGSMIVSHTNDSYFWVVTKFSGMSVRQGLKLQTLGTLVSGLAAAAVLMIMALIYG